MQTLFRPAKQTCCGKADDLVVDMQCRLIVRIPRPFIASKNPLPIRKALENCAAMDRLTGQKVTVLKCERVSDLSFQKLDKRATRYLNRAKFQSGDRRCHLAMLPDSTPALKLLQVFGTELRWPTIPRSKFARRCCA